MDYLWRPGSIITNVSLVAIIVIVASNIITIAFKYDNSDQIQIMSFCATEAEGGGWVIYGDCSIKSVAAATRGWLAQ